MFTQDQFETRVTCIYNDTLLALSSSLGYEDDQPLTAEAAVTVVVTAACLAAAAGPLQSNGHGCEACSKNVMITI